MIELSPIEIMALRKLEIVSKALAQKLGGAAGREQLCLAQTLGDVLDRAEISGGLTAQHLARRAR